MRSFLSIGLLVFLSFTFTLSGPVLASSWTIMVFMNADNNLEEEALVDFIEMVSAPLPGSADSTLKVLVQLDRVPGYASAREGYWDDWAGTMRFVLSPLLAPFSNNAVQNLGEVNMGSAEALVDFVSWAMDRYPANHYALIIWDHGDGWRTINKGRRSSWKIAGYDETSGDYLYMDELQTALRILKDKGYKIDIIVFDACLMGMVEVAYELKDFASYMVASEDLVPGEGFRYDLFLTDLVSLLRQGDVSPKDLGKLMIESYKETSGKTLSLIDLRRIDDMTSLLRELSDKLKDNISLAKLARRQATKFFDSSIMDLYSFSAFLAGWKSPISELASSLCESIKGAVVDNYSRDGNSYGLSIYFPDRGEGSYDRFYDDPRHDFPSFTKWNEFLKTYLRETQEVISVAWGEMEINGVISDSEVKNAAVITSQEITSFALFAKNNQSSLYMAFRIYADNSLDVGDSIIIYLDSDRSFSFPSDRTQSEGMLRILYDGRSWLAYFYPLWYDYSEYRVRSLDPILCREIKIEGKVSANNYLEIEVGIPMGSRFPFKAGDLIGYYVQVYDGKSSSFVGEYPQLMSMDWSEQVPTIYIPPRLEPLMYGGLKLSSSGDGDDDDDEFIASSGCSVSNGGSLSVLILLSVGWLIVLGVRKW